MTREEAKGNLTHAIRWNDMPKKEALEMAIKALEQEPCSDAISRQWLMECVNEGWIKFDTKKDKNRFIHLVRDMAPTQPKMGRWIEYEVRLPDRTILNYRCSVCGRKLIGYTTETLSEAPFCHCGAKMQEMEDE